MSYILDSEWYAALIAAGLALIAIAALALEREYLLEPVDSIRAVAAEDDCAEPTKEVRRFNGQLYCIGEYNQ